MQGRFFVYVYIEKKSVGSQSLQAAGYVDIQILRRKYIQ